MVDERKKEEKKAEKPETYLAFFYGTLMSDGCRAHVLKDEKFIGKVTTKPEYLMVDCGSYPGMVIPKDGEKGRAIEGELYEVKKTLIPRLDGIEGVAYGLYRMQQVNIEGHEGPIYAYFFQRRSDNSKMFDKDRWDNSR